MNSDLIERGDDRNVLVKGDTLDGLGKRHVRISKSNTNWAGVWCFEFCAQQDRKMIKSGQLQYLDWFIVESHEPGGRLSKYTYIYTYKN